MSAHPKPEEMARDALPPRASDGRDDRRETLIARGHRAAGIDEERARVAAWLRVRLGLPVVLAVGETLGDHLADELEGKAQP